MKKSSLIFLIFIFGLSFWLRSNNLSSPFWVDEFSTASQAKLIIENNNNYVLENNNFLNHLLISLSFRINGFSTESARVVSLLAGSLIPMLVFLLSKKTIGHNAALASSLLTIFSYFQIVWSRQARGYALQQLFLLSSLLLYSSILQSYSNKKIILLLITFILGAMTHFSFAIVIFSIIIHYLIFNQKFVQKNLAKFLLGFSPLFIFFILKIDSIAKLVQNLTSFKVNNLAYYHSFLWREQTIITLLAFLGILLMVSESNKRKVTIIFLLPIVFYLLFHSFIFAPYVSRYLLPVFPLLIMFAGVTIARLAELISKKYNFLFSLIITFFIISNGDKFSLKPKIFYSVNHDMREIALVNYDKVYAIVKEKGELDKGETAVIDTWSDRTRWYLGDNKEYYYIFRWANSDGLINGLKKYTSFDINQNNEKFIPTSGNPPVKLISEQSDLQKTLNKYPKGFIIIDDSSLPEDVINFAKTNFKQEIYLEHFPLDDNPYSLWPLTLYSWGIN